ncbi:hypothetical protein NL676_019530 [Syzygium grande]|nr:hypothetical protein NL676_019530 [Syzygium grande]
MEHGLHRGRACRAERRRGRPSEQRRLPTLARFGLTAEADEIDGEETTTGPPSTGRGALSWVSPRRRRRRLGPAGGLLWVEQKKAQCIPSMEHSRKPPPGSTFHPP